MIRTLDSLLHDLRDMDRLIAALSTSFDIDDEDIEDLRWLRARRRFLLLLLAVRRDQRGKKVVSLELWRHGNVTAPSGARKAVNGRGALAVQGPRQRMGQADLDQCVGALDGQHSVQADGSVP